MKYRFSRALDGIGRAEPNASCRRRLLRLALEQFLQRQVLAHFCGRITLEDKWARIGTSALIRSLPDFDQRFVTLMVRKPYEAEALLSAVQRALG